MPEFEEIYRDFPETYDRLVSFEDPEGRLFSRLLESTPMIGGRVLELGVGTGRITKNLVRYADEVIGFDRSSGMLEKAREVLNQTGFRNWRLATADHLLVSFPDTAADVIIEGWSYGHLVLEQPERLEQITRELVERSLRWCAPGGAIVIIETLGTGTQVPRVPDPLLNEFYEMLENTFGFTREVVRTDFVFPDENTAIELLGFFFGDELAGTVRSQEVQSSATGEGSEIDKRPPVTVPECTGIWRLEA